MAVVAGARCSLGSIGEPDVAWFWQPVNSWAADEYFFEVVGELSIPPGDCATDTDAHQAWEFVGDGGDLLCAVGSREAQVVWTYADAGVLGIAIRGDGDVGALYSWWREHARTLGAP